MSPTKVRGTSGWTRWMLVPDGSGPLTIIDEFGEPRVYTPDEDGRIEVTREQDIAKLVEMGCVEEEP